MLVDRDSKDFERYANSIYDVCAKRYPDANADKLTNYILDNISRQEIVVLNSERDWSLRGASATNPKSLFTIIIGGNIVSRGVTLDNLLSMFFTRDVKHKIQQDTYIQRARMFGARGRYLRSFELTIPEDLYRDWHRCFVFHRLALSAIKEGLGSLVWLGDKRVSPVATASIDKSTVNLNKGEMGLPLFDYNHDRIEAIIESDHSSFDKMEMFVEEIGEDAFPQYLRNYVLGACPHNSASIAFHPAHSLDNYTSGVNEERIERDKGFIGTPQERRTMFPQAVHHFKVFYNRHGRARLIYKFKGSIQFIKNVKP